MRKVAVGGVFVLVVCCICLPIFVFRSDLFYSKKLVKAIRTQNIDEVERILDQNPGCINIYPSVAPKWWHSVMDLRVMYPLTEACMTGNKELIELLVEKGADVNCNDGRTPLSVIYTQKKEGWYQISLYLIDAGASLNYITEYSGQHLSVLRDIVQAKPGTHSTGLMLDSDEEIMSAFVYAIENLDHSNVNWRWVLLHSVCNDRVQIVRFLLDQGYCGVNDTYADMTALMFAARDSTKEMVKLLLEYGADKNITTSEGKNAYDYAVESNNDSVMDILRIR